MIARYEMTFNLDDPIDAAIWSRLNGYKKLRRASKMIRECLAQMWLHSEPGQLVPAYQSAGPLRAIRPTRPMDMAPEPPTISASINSTGEADEAAADTFLSMFG